jgi:muramoyltetrapeptide carboxypeptidase
MVIPVLLAHMAPCRTGAAQVHSRRFMEKMFWMCAALAAAVMAVPAAPAAEGDAELSAETSKDEFRYAGVFPDGVETVACISPASYPGNPKHRRGVELLEKAGLKVKVMPHAFTRPEPGKGAAPLADRLEDFYAAWNDPEVDMILCIRGGDGSGELLENLDWSRLGKCPDLYFQGFSDITLITGALLAKGCGHPVAGPMAGGLPGLRDPFIAEMKAMYHGEAVGPCKVEPLVAGNFSGFPLMGHLKRLVTLARSDYRPDIRGRVVFIESVRSTPEGIREQLRTMVERKFFDGAAGVVFCQFVKCGAKEEVDAVLREMAPELGVPVCRGFPFGHSSRCATIDFRRRVVVEDGMLTFPPTAPSSPRLP